MTAPWKRSGGAPGSLLSRWLVGFLIDEEWHEYLAARDHLAARVPPVIAKEAGVAYAKRVKRETTEGEARVFGSRESARSVIKEARRNGFIEDKVDGEGQRMIRLVRTPRWYDGTGAR